MASRRQVYTIAVNFMTLIYLKFVAIPANKTSENAVLSVDRLYGTVPGFSDVHRF